MCVGRCSGMLEDGTKGCLKPESILTFPSLMGVERFPRRVRLLEHPNPRYAPAYFRPTVASLSMAAMRAKSWVLLHSGSSVRGCPSRRPFRAGGCSDVLLRLSAASSSLLRWA